jgi:Zn-dependent metalloprotease
MCQNICCIVPKDVLERLAGDKKLSDELRKTAADSARITDLLRTLRQQHAELTAVAHAMGAHLVQLAASPKITVYDCKHTQNLPGTPVSHPGKSKDRTAKRVFMETTSIAKFYKAVFNRNSIDDAGMTMMSSIHELLSNVVYGGRRQAAS